MVTLTGNFKYQDGSAVANGILTLALSQPCTITATGQVAPLQQKVQLDANGAIPANTSVYGNDALTPSGTVYVATLYAANKNAAGAYVPSDQLSMQNWSLTGTSVDVSTLTPTSPNISYVSPVTSVALTMPGEFSVSGSPVTAAGTLAVAKANQSANLVYAGPSTGAAAAPAFRALVSADLPLPGATSPGAVESKAAVAHQFLTSIGTDGSVGQAALVAADIPTIATMALKTGTGAGNYTSSSASYVDVDGTNLAYTVTIPTGSKLLVRASGTVFSSTAAQFMFVSLFDGATLVEREIFPPGVNDHQTFALDWIITGDGASHTVKLQYKTANTADAINMANSPGTMVPTMTFLMMPSN